MNIKDLTDRELMEWFRIAVEMHDSRYIKALRKEMTRRNSDE